MLRMAWRNLWRNRGRTSIIIAVVGFTLGMLLVSYGMTLDRKVKFIEAAIRTTGGNVLVHADGFWDARTSDLQIPEAGAVAERVAGVEGVDHVIPRVLINGLLTSTHGAEGVQLYGVDLDDEAHVYDYRPHLVDGEWFEPGDAIPLVLGVGLVEHLEVELGDRIVLTATDPGGEVTRALFRLSGAIETGNSMLDDGFGLTTIGAAQDALGMEDRLTQLGVVIADDEQRYAVSTAIGNAIQVDTAGLEVLTWDEAIPDLLGYVEIDDRFGAIFGVVIFMVVAFGIANTLLMMVMERIRELGMLNAIGMSNARIACLVFTETALMTAISVVIGVGLGLFGHFMLVEHGIDIAELAGGDMDISGVSMSDTTIRSVLDPLRWTLATLLVVVLIFASSLYPAWRAARLDPVEAMRTFE